MSGRDDLLAAIAKTYSVTATGSEEMDFGWLADSLWAKRVRVVPADSATKQFFDPASKVFRDWLAERLHVCGINCPARWHAREFHVADAEAILREYRS